MSNIMKYFGAETGGGDAVNKYINGDISAENVQAPTNNLMDVVQTGINLALGIVGILAVVMIIAGGISYTTSAGDAAKVKKAKDTILYGVVGLVIALLAFAIVNFILTNVFGS